VLTTAGPIARSVADLRLALEEIGGPDSHDPEVRRCLAAGRVSGTERAAGRLLPGYPPLVAAEICAGADRLAAELDKLGGRPGPAAGSRAGGSGQLVEDLMARTCGISGGRAFRATHLSGATR
jgi:hypothetical protein